jgi:hypothetical protein
MKGVKIKMMGRMKHTAQVGKMRNSYKSLVENPEIKEITQLTCGWI